MTKNNDVLSKILFESKSYKEFEEIEKLVEMDMDLSMVPIQPLYVSMQNMTTDQIAVILPKLSKKQRRTLIDLDLWKKDVVDVFSFEYWIEVYSKVQDLEITKQFVQSEEFLLYLKSRINIHTFDTEDPEYPDSDYYFLTDDMLLLIEYSEEFKYPAELKFLIRNLYDSHGVEGAYTILFKLINDSFSMLQEDTYNDKKERLREFGFVDHFDALEKTFDFVGFKSIDNFILKAKAHTAVVDIVGRNQSLHSSALVSFQGEDMKNIFEELSMIKEGKRASYLHFTFIKLINSTITLSDALKGGRIELTRVGKMTRNYLELGLQKVRSLREFKEGESVFDTFDFFDVYRIGSSLISLERKRIKKALKSGPFNTDDYEYFLGAWWSSFLENSEKEIPKVKSFGAGLNSKDINSLATYEFWHNEVTLFVSMLPFIETFFTFFSELKKNGSLHDDFYLNYDVENIDFESIIISSFINYVLGNFTDRDVKKMGVTVSELRAFLKEYFIKKENEYILLSFDDPKIQKFIGQFITQFGFPEISHIDKFFYGILSEHLSGYEFDTLEEEDFKHIGGPILLNTTTN